MMTLKKCLFFDLQSGTVFIAVIAFIRSLLDLMDVVNCENSNKTIINKNENPLTLAISIFNDAFVILNFLFSIVLLLGSVNAKPALLLAWICVETCSLFWHTIVYLRVLIFHFKEIPNFDIVMFTFYAILSLYFIFVVASYYKHLKNYSGSFQENIAPIMSHVIDLPPSYDELCTSPLTAGRLQNPGNTIQYYPSLIPY